MPLSQLPHAGAALEPKRPPLSSGGREGLKPSSKPRTLVTPEASRCLTA
jgi:hypothetical protein